MKNKHQIFNPDGSLNKIALEGSISDLYKVSDDSAFQKTAESQQDTYNRVTYLQPPKNIGTEITEATDPTSLKSASLSVFWEEAKGADRYQTELVIGGETEAARINESTDTTTVFPGLTGTLSLSVRVRSIAGREFSAWSDPVSVTIHYNSLGLQIPQNLVAKKLFSFVHCAVDQPPKSQSGSKIEFFVAKLADVDPVTFEFTPKESQKKATAFGNHCWFFDTDNETIYVKARAYDDSGKYSNYTAVATSSKFGEIANDWDPELEIVDGSQGAIDNNNYRMGAKFKAYAPAADAPPVAGYTVRYQKDEDESALAWLWIETYYTADDIYEAGASPNDYLYVTLPALGRKETPLSVADIGYNAQIRVVDSTMAVSAWKPDPALAFTVYDNTDPPEPDDVVDLEVVNAAGFYSGAQLNEFGVFTCFCTLGLPEVGDHGVVENLIEAVTYRVRTETWPKLWSIQTSIDINDLDSVTEGGIAYRMLRVPNLDPNTTHEIQMKYIDFTGDISNAGDWSTPIANFTTDTPEVWDGSDMTNFSALIYQREQGWFKWKTYFLNIEFDVPADLDYYAQSIQFKIAWPNWWGGYSYTSHFHNDLIDGTTNDHVELQIPMMFPVPNEFNPGASSGVKVQVRAWMNLKSGDPFFTGSWLDQSAWTDADSDVKFGDAKTETYEAFTGQQTPEVIWFRTVRVAPVPDAYDLPANYERVDIHAVAKGSAIKETWPTSVRQTFSGHDGETTAVEVPFFLWDSTFGATGGYRFVWDIKDVDIKYVLKVWEATSPASIVTAGTSAALNANDTNSGFDIGEGITANSVNQVTVFGGDLVLAPNVRSVWNFLTSDTTLYVENRPAGVTSDIITAGDLVVLAKQNRTVSTASEVMRVTASSATTLTVSRNYKTGGTAEAGFAGNLLIKIGEYNSEYRYQWLDASSDTYKVIKTDDDGSGGITTTTQVELGAPAADPQWNEGDIYISGDHKMEVTGDFELKAGGEMKLSAGTVTIAGSTVNMTAGNFNVTSTGSVNITATGGLNMTGGSTVFSGGAFTLSGTTVAISGSAVSISSTGYIDCTKAKGIKVSNSGGIHVYDGKSLMLEEGGDLIFEDICVMNAVTSGGNDFFLLEPDASATASILRFGSSSNEWEPYNPILAAISKWTAIMRFLLPPELRPEYRLAQIFTYTPGQQAHTLY